MFFNLKENCYNKIYNNLYNHSDFKSQYFMYSNKLYFLYNLLLIIAVFL